MGNGVEKQLTRLRGALEHGRRCEQCDDPSCPPGTRRPWAQGLRDDDYEFGLETFEGEPCVVLEFSHDEAPAIRFRHRFAPPSEAGEPDYRDVHFMENVETRKLTRSRARVGPEARIVWTDFSWGHPANRLGRVMDLLRERNLDKAVAVLRGVDATDWDLQLADDISRAAACDPPDGADVQALYTRCREEQETRRNVEREMTARFWEEHAGGRG